MSSTRTLETLVEMAQTTTGAGAAVLLAPTVDGGLEIVAVAGPDRPDDRFVDPAETYAGMVLASQQPMAVRVGPDDRLTRFEARLLGHPPSALCCVPCVGRADISGVLVLADKDGGGAFDFDDVEVATMLAEIAGTALEEREGAVDVPGPEALAGVLRELARSDGERYRRIASLIEMLLASG